MTSEDDKDSEDTFHDGADHLADTLKFMLTSKKFRAKFPEVHQQVREHIRSLAKLEADMSAEDEDQAEAKEPVKTVEGAQKAFKRANMTVLQDVKKRFRA